MQNWNAGKTQEYRERREYKVESSHLTHNGPLPDGEATARLAGKSVPAEQPAPQPAAPVQATAGDKKKALFFKTATCPNCRIAASYLDKAGYAYEPVLADENAELAVSYGVKQAPTLIVFDGDAFTKYAGAGAIKSYLNSL